MTFQAPRPLSYGLSIPFWHFEGVDRIEVQCFDSVMLGALSKLTCPKRTTAVRDNEHVTLTRDRVDPHVEKMLNRNIKPGLLAKLSNYALFGPLPGVELTTWEFPFCTTI